MERKQNVASVRQSDLSPHSSNCRKETGYVAGVILTTPSHSGDASSAASPAMKMIGSAKSAATTTLDREQNVASVRQSDLSPHSSNCRKKEMKMKMMTRFRNQMKI